VFAGLLLTALWLAVRPCAAALSAADALQAADQADAALQRQLEPDLNDVSLEEMGSWEASRLLRFVAREQSHAALATLRARARDEGNADADVARLALMVWARANDAGPALALFAKLLSTAAGPQAAGLRRHQVAWVDLPTWVSWQNRPLRRASDQRFGHFVNLDSRLIQAFQAAIELDPQDAWSWVMLARLQDQRADLGFFERGQASIVARDVAAVAWLHQMARWMAGHGQRGKALALWQYTVDVLAEGRADPQVHRWSTHALLTQGAAHLQMNQIEPVRALFAQALQAREARVTADRPYGSDLPWDNSDYSLSKKE
jgi:tetratricopeptide (TPR) repeat protein